MQVSTRMRKSSPRPTLWASYHAYASSRSAAASGAMMSSAAMAAANPPLDLLPGQARCRIIPEVGFASFQLLDLPVVDRNVLGSRRQVVPEVFDELQLLLGAQVEERFVHPVHDSSHPGRRR